MMETGPNNLKKQKMREDLLKANIEGSVRIVAVDQSKRSKRYNPKNCSLARQKTTTDPAKAHHLNNPYQYKR